MVCKKLFNRSIWPALALCCSLFSPGILFAQVGNGITIDTKALSLGGAVVADIDPHLAAVYHNPAGVAKLKERQFEAEQMLVGLDADATFYAPPDYRLFGLDGTGFNRYDETVPRDPVVGADGQGKSHTNKGTVYIPGFGLQQLPWSGPIPLLPQIGFSVNPPGSKFTFANKWYMHSPLNLFKDAEDDGRYLGKEAAIQRFTYFSPAIGYQINDEWAVGFGVQLSHQGFAIAQDNRAPNLLIAVVEIIQDAFACEFDKPIGQRRDPLQPFLSVCQGNVGPWDSVGRIDLDMQQSLSPTYNFGVLWEPTDWFSMGMSYMSEAEMKLQGTFLMNYTDEWTAFWQGFNASLIGAITAATLGLPRGVPRESGIVNMDYTVPQMFKTGFRARITPDWTLSADATWTDWSVWDEWEFNFDRTLEVFTTARLLSTLTTGRDLTLPLGLEDTWHYGFGLTHHLNSRLDIRYGLELRKSPVGQDVFGPVPVGDMKTWGIGFGYKWDKQTQVSATMFYMQSIDYIPSNTSCNLNCTTLTNVIYNPYAGLDVKFSTRIFGLGVSFRRQF